MPLTEPAPFACALVIICAMSAAGVVHTCWMRSRRSLAFRIPVDAGLRWRGERLFGANKTLAGFVAIVRRMQELAADASVDRLLADLVSTIGFVESLKPEPDGV